MRIRSEIITVGVLIVTVAFLMNQTPQMTDSNLSPAASDSSDSAVVAMDLSGPDISAGVSGAPFGVTLLLSQYLRKSKETFDGNSIFSVTTRPEPVSRRDQVMIMVDILTFASQPVSRKGILKRLNLSQCQLKKYLGFLIEKHLLLEEFGEARTYRITENGRAFLRLIED